MSTHLLALQSALEKLPQTSRLMGLDLGTKTIGIATSDRSRQIATPITTITRTKFTKDATELLAIAAKENVGVLVLGLPINMDGTRRPAGAGDAGLCAQSCEAHAAGDCVLG